MILFSFSQVSELEFPSSSFSVTALCHPPTYVNKVLLGSAQGRMQLWNLRTLKKVHSFKGWPEGGGVACLEAAPAAVDVVAVGLKVNFKYVFCVSNVSHFLVGFYIQFNLIKVSFTAT